MGDFLNTYEQSSKSSHISLLRPKTEFHATLSEVNLFADHYEDIQEQPNS